jgi:predicted nucleic acid-binding Zn ribbon protein
MQIAGSACEICGEEIVFSDEGKFCPRCNIYVHGTCEPKDKCSGCGQPFDFYDRPKSERWRDALSSPESRPFNPALSIFIVGLVLGFVVLILWYLFEDALAHGY